MRAFLFPLAIVAAFVFILRADEPKAESTQATFLIAGLHCPPCTKTVEGSLKRAKGVRSVSIDWRTKNAKIEFDESKLSAQSLAQIIHSTPHMMGGGLKDKETAEKAKAFLKKVAGVASVAVYPDQGSVGVQFNANAKAKTTSMQLIDTLEAEGLVASNLK